MFLVEDDTENVQSIKPLLKLAELGQTIKMALEKVRDYAETFMGLPLDGASLSTIKAFSLTSQNEKKTIICVNGGAGHWHLWTSVSTSEADKVIKVIEILDL